MLDNAVLQRGVAPDIMLDGCPSWRDPQWRGAACDGLEVGMYRIDHPNAQTMVVCFVPWTQRAIGLILILAGAAILLLPFPTVARLRCDREQDTCTLEQTNLVRARLIHWSAGDLTGARLQEVASEGAAYRIWVSTREGERAFTPYSIGGSWRAKLAVVAQVQAYARDPSVETLDVIEDERPLFYAFAAGTTVLTSGSPGFN